MKTVDLSQVLLAMLVFNSDIFSSSVIWFLGDRYKSQFTLCYGTVVLSVLSVTLVYCG